MCSSDLARPGDPVRRQGGADRPGQPRQGSAVLLRRPAKAVGLSGSSPRAAARPVGRVTRVVGPPTGATRDAGQASRGGVAGRDRPFPLRPEELSRGRRRMTSLAAGDLAPIVAAAIAAANPERLVLHRFGCRGDELLLDGAAWEIPVRLTGRLLVVGGGKAAAGVAAAIETLAVTAGDRKSTRLNSRHSSVSRMPSSA